MSRILKRPMFRKGGSVDEGIVSLGRKNYADGPGPALDPNDPLIQDAQRREALLRQYAGPAGDSKQDLYDMLIQGGLNLVSGTGAGKTNCTIFTKKTWGRSFSKTIKTISGYRSSRS